MSIKSQKSLSLECSEIIEKSYSVRSCSEESLSGDDADESLARELLRKMTPAILSKLRRCFKKGKGKDQRQDIDRRVEEVMRLAAAEEGIEFSTRGTDNLQHDKLWLDEAGFVSAIRKVFGDHKFTTHARKLYCMLDPFITGRILWRHLVDKLADIGAKRTLCRGETWQGAVEGIVRRLSHCKRESIVKMVSIECKDSFSYVAVSKGGRVGVYSGDMALLQTYEVFYHRTGLRHRVKNCWITDAVYMPDVQCLTLCASDRSLTIYDVSTITHFPQFCVTGIPNIPTCLSYLPASSWNTTSELMFGTERGEIIRMRFLQPRVTLLHNKGDDSINYYFWMELSSPPHTSYCSITRWRSHARSVRRLAHTRGGDIVWSCSHDGNVSVRARHKEGRIDDYVFKVHRGVTCFHVVASLQMLVTGSNDGIVRVWGTTPRGVAKPHASLVTSHRAHVSDVTVVAPMELIVAVCSDCWIYIWDMYEETLLQRMQIKFPFLNVLGKKIEFGAACIYPGPARQRDRSEDHSLITSGRMSAMSTSTGGLVLESSRRSLPNDDKDPEFTRYNRPDIVIAICDYVRVLKLSEDKTTILPPPKDSGAERKPEWWDVDESYLRRDDKIDDKPSPVVMPTPTLLYPQSQLTARMPHSIPDLDELLERADLRGVLEKDFVLMQGLKSDLNRKLLDMHSKVDTVWSFVSLGAPYLALDIHDVLPTNPGDEMMDRYSRVMSLFPGPSVVNTPNTSENSTPRSRKRGSLKLPNITRTSP